MTAPQYFLITDENKRPIQPGSEDWAILDSHFKKTTKPCCGIFYSYGQRTIVIYDEGATLLFETYDNPTQMNATISQRGIEIAFVLGAYDHTPSDDDEIVTDAELWDD